MEIEFFWDHLLKNVISLELKDLFLESQFYSYWFFYLSYTSITLSFYSIMLSFEITKGSPNFIILSQICLGFFWGFLHFCENCEIVIVCI